MKFTDYYEIMGLERGAPQDEIRRAYRKLARKYHPDVSKEADAEERFKELGEAYEVLKDPEKRAAYDRMGSGWRAGQDFEPPPNWDEGFEFHGRGADESSRARGDFSDFFEELFGHRSRGARPQGPQAGGFSAKGEDHHARVTVELEDTFRGARRAIALRMPSIDEEGRLAMQERTLEIDIPKGIREGQHLRLAGQGAPGIGGAPAGDLYLEISFRPHPVYRVDGRDVYLDLPVTPTEAALGATVTAPTPVSAVQLTVPPGSGGGRKLRLKGRGIPGATPGDLYAVLTLVLPPADTEAAKDAYRALAKAAPFDPRAHLGV